MRKLILLVAFGVMFTTLVSAQNRETRNVGNFTKLAFRVPGKLYLRQGSPQKVEIEGRKDILKEIETEVEGSRLVIGKEGRWMNWDWDNDDKVNVYITVPDLEAISVSGSGDLIGQGKFNAKDLDLNVSGSGSLVMEVEATGDLEADVSGSGDLEIKGKCRRFNSDVSGSGDVSLTLNITETADFGVSGSGKILASGSAQSVKAGISGSGKVLASDLNASTCEVRITGSGDVEISVKDALDANITGSGTVRYKGNPNKVNSHSSGSGSVRKL